MKKSLKRILCAILVLVFIFANANVVLAADVFEIKPKFVSPTLYASSEEVALAAALPFDEEKFQAYLLEQLKVLPADEECIVEIDISQFKIPYTDENYQALFNLIWYESPELFRAQSLAVGGYDTFNTLYVECVADFCDPRCFAECSDLMESVVDDLVSGVKGNNNLSDVEKALILHDRLATYCEYDYDRLQNDTLPSASYTAYGILGMGTGVCMGYTLAYDYLLEQVGIKSDYCSSEELNHAWNIVYINNIPYHVDVTWDDPVRDVSGRVLHDNFLRSTEGIKATGHNADDFTTTPTDTTYDDYFWQNSQTAFQLIGDTIYYVDNHQSGGRLIALDGINDAIPEILEEFDFTWYYDKAEGTYWSDNYTRLGCIRDLLYYSTPESVCSYNPVTRETKELITAEDIAESYGEENLNIFGFTTYKCFYYGEYSNTPGYSATTKEKYFSGVSHNPTENWKTVKEPTSLSQGKEVNTCIDCGQEITSRLIPALDDQHVWSEWYIDVNNPPTCTDKGVILRDCSHCGTQEWDYGTALGHNYGDEFITKEPTCGIDGIKYRACSRCDAKVDITNISATKEHKASDTWVTGKVATCGSDGYDVLLCANCGVEMDRKTIDQLSQHGETEIVGAKNATCSGKGYTGDTRCKICKTVTDYGTDIPEIAHTPSEWMTRTPATYVTDGVEYRICTVCKTELGTRTIPKKVHSSDGGKITKPATCTETGVKTYKCTKCGAVIKTEVIPTTGHTVVAVKGYAATCVKTGLTDGTKCSTCDTVIAAQKIIPATGKHVTTLVGHKPATFEADGHTGKEVCTVCTQIINQGAVIPKLTFVTPTVTVTAKNNGINVSWNAVENAQSYIIYRRVYNASTKKWSGWTRIKTGYALNSYVDSSVVLGTNYRYTVRAVNGNAMSAYTSTGTIKYDVTPTVKVANATNGVKVSWNTAVNATGYRVYRSTYSNGKWSGWKNMGTAKATATAWTDKNVKTNVSYKYTVRAVYNKVLSSYNKSGASVKFLTTPTVKIANASNGIKVSWNKITGATSYVVYSSQYNPTTNKWSSWANRGTVNATNWVDKTTQSGVTYKYTVRAVNGKSLSAYVGSSGLMFLAQPTVTIANASNGIKVTWSQSAGATGYTVYRSEYDAKTKKWSSWKSRGTAAATKSSWTDKNVTSGKYYRYTVRAKNGSSASSYIASNSVKR